MSAPLGGDGTFGVTVWPAFVGFCTCDPGPGPIPYGEPTSSVYQRGQIFWATETFDAIEQIVGRAFVILPKTHVLLPFTHQAFFSGPEGNNMTGKCQLDQPLSIPSDGLKVECYPIMNPDMVLNKAQGIDY